MQKLWSLENFSLGLHSQNGKVENGESYALSVENLLADKEGYLQLSPELRAANTEGTGQITGAATAAEHIILIRAGRASILTIEDLSNETDLDIPDPGIGVLSGRVSVVAATSNKFMIWTTEGTDSGFWTDLREGNDFATYFLGIPAPENEPSTTIPLSTSPAAYKYLYRYAYVREFDDPNEVMKGVESNLSPTQEQTTPLAFGDGIDTGQSVTVTIEAPPHDAQYTGIYVYRSSNVGLDYDTDDENPDFLPFRRIAYLPIGTTDYTDEGYNYQPNAATGDDEVTTRWGDCPLFEPGNDRLPSSVKSFIYVGGRLYAACEDEVRFSDIRGISFDLWRFADNLVPVETDKVDFVASFQDVVLFGARDATYRIDLDHTNIDRISDRGPLDSFSIAQTERGLSFVSSDGIYATDAVQVANVVDLALDGEFRDFLPETGNVISLGEYGSIFQAEGHDHGSPREVVKAFLFHDKAFWKWKLNRLQFLSFVENERQFYVTDSSDLKEIRIFDENEDDEQAWEWQSQELDFGTRLNKAFTELRFQTSAGVAVELTAVCDGREKVINFTTVDRFQPQRVRVDMRGRRFQFKISGTGPIVIRNMELWGRVIER